MVLGLMTVLVFVGGIMLFVLGTASLFEHFAMGLMFIGLGIAAEGSCLLLICGCILFYGVFLGSQGNHSALPSGGRLSVSQGVGG